MSQYLYNNLTKTSDTTVSLTVSSDQPYLKDHNVGLPLFGTVLSIEAMAEAKSLEKKQIRCIKNIVSGKDCLFQPASENELTCIVSGDNVSLSCKDELIFRCEMYDKVCSECPDHALMPFSFTSGEGACSEDIYSCLFHGPSLQVLNRAVAKDKYILSEMNLCLPSLSSEAGREPLLPIRVIEFCLQSSGMWELAFTNCVSVPLSIAQINLYTDRQISGTVYAIAEMRSDGGHITAFDENGNALVEVIGYKTKQMPYESGDFTLLHSKLTASFLN